ncbi:MAG TPA: hypothetical protein VFJ66_01070 [Gaiellales bacterium]|nr:hypothetical protein [Gaiellales bacterium]
MTFSAGAGWDCRDRCDRTAPDWLELRFDVDAIVALLLATALDTHFPQFAEMPLADP